MFNRRSFLTSTASLSIAPHLLWAQAATTKWAPALSLAREYDQIHSLVVAQSGKITLGEVFRGPALDRPVNVKSVSKTVVAALTGAALDRGEITGVDQTLGQVIPDLIPATADPRVQDITLEHLITMQAGLARTSGANYGDWVSSRNWVAYALNRDMVGQPGKGMLYSTGSFHVLGAALAKASGQSLLTQARRRLGDPLGIEIRAWSRDPQGYYLGGNEMSLSPMAMIRFGEMYRMDGQWDGQQVLSPAWVEQSFVRRTRSLFSGLGYGYGWFLGQSNGHDFALARGYGGQIICVVPDLEMTIAITSDPYRPARSGGYFGALMRLINQIVPIAEMA
ncbi:serine hydrolase domain-containing protein [Parasulfitobacter algicola]|uniref:Serine hydrolase n=1 Tax=Parasulfitobacter algicola TaxID=2614809 RepID=A0ABX2IWL8_9RHOB|nr:serine hydrolase [Sulfitobacter algicola]NSX54741.1 serine hydrolase [Sulfitobacter algicola]